jgi:hypothetical protein
MGALWWVGLVVVLPTLSFHQRRQLVFKGLSARLPSLLLFRHLSELRPRVGQLGGVASRHLGSGLLSRLVLCPLSGVVPFPSELLGAVVVGVGGEGFIAVGLGDMRPDVLSGAVMAGVVTVKPVEDDSRALLA